jgi:two-component system chemotaxis response regulator CheY
MLNVLVVDDSAVVRKVVRRIVEGMDMRITEADSCQEGLAICEQEMPGAVIVDGSLSDIRPFDFIRRLRQMPGGDGPRVIFCSTENDVIQLAGASRSGSNMFLLKPFTRDELVSRLEDLAA